MQLLAIQLYKFSCKLNIFECIYFRSFSMHLLWGMMNTLQLIGIMLKFDINVPPNAYIFFKYIDDFLSMKAQIINDYLEKFNSLFVKDSQNNDIGLKEQNSSIIDNIGTIILSAVGLFLAMIFTLILIKFSDKSPFLKNLAENLKNKLFFNSVLRTCV